ncbi:membrane protein [Streptomyces sulfonofaciens]|uniref:Membrane protein n=1 Tax=Streptomyces sulfonofaciens TaxID=68272 RepID=A0A919GL77_9ACTN|nr:PP2C family protein-serine/threonine phosphatase [Streptomyces sulfonofaciens]GHH86058.1 membrane protein [Streptomyces sulfonofaciens]
MPQSTRSARRSYSSLLICIVLLVGGAMADLFGPRPYTGLPLLAAAPLVAGALLSFRLALAVAVLACVLSVVLDHQLEHSVVALVVDVTDIAVVGLTALLVNVTLQRQRRRLVRAIDVSEAAQRAILPDLPSTAGPLRVAGRYEAALAEARIGGDLYAVQPTPFGVRALIGDVRGKGLQAVGTVSVAIGAFRQEAEHAPAVGELARRMDHALRLESERRSAPTDAEEFTTAVLAEFSSDGGTVRLVNHGHPSPYLVHEATVTLLDPGSRRLPLGMGLAEARAGGAPQPDSVTLPCGAFLLLITDGVIEARNADGEFYDPTTGVLALRAFENPGELVDALVHDIFQWTGAEPQDDIAVVALTRAPAPSWPSAHAYHREPVPRRSADGE